MSEETLNILKVLRGTFPWFLFMILSGSVTGLLLIPQTYLFAKLITYIPIHTHNGAMILQFWLVLGMVILARGCCRYIMEWTGARLSIQIKSILRKTLFNEVLRRGTSGLNQAQAGEWIHTIYTDIENVAPFFRLALPQAVFGVLIPLSVLITVFYIDWISGLILLITAPLIPFFMILLGYLARQNTKRRWFAMRHLAAHFFDIVSGLTTLKWFNRSKAQEQVVAKVGERYRQATMDTLKVAFLSSFAMELIATIGTAMVAVGVGLRLLAGHLPFLDALVTIMLAGEFYIPLRSLGSQFHASMEGRIALQHIGAILTAPTLGRQVAQNEPFHTHEPAIQMSPSTDAKSFRPLFQIENATYTYPGTEKPALHEVSLAVYKGDHVAVVGPTGSGKSTLFSMLIGAVQPQTGNVYVRAERLCEKSMAAWRRDISYIGQYPYIFSGTVLENILLSRPSAELSEVRSVAEQAGVEAFVQWLPHGYETKIGSGGTPLSRGQIQRIALARMLLKPCSIWFLDEPTAHLDVESEHWFRQVIHHLPSSQTVLIIAHRLSTVERMDKAFLLQDGRVTTIESPDGAERSEWFKEMDRYRGQLGG